MSFEPVLAHIIAALEKTRIEYMLVGSFASTYYGAPRTTQDIDVLIDATPDQLRVLVDSFPQTDYYADFASALEAHRNQSMFNVIDFKSGWKIDFIMRKMDGFGDEEFRRRARVDVDGVILFVATAEDVVISKLRWAKLSQSARQIEDVAGIVKIYSPRLDRTYVSRWVEELDLRQEWAAALDIAGADDRT